METVLCSIALKAKFLPKPEKIEGLYVATFFSALLAAFDFLKKVDDLLPPLSGFYHLARRLAVKCGQRRIEPLGIMLAHESVKSD